MVGMSGRVNGLVRTMSLRRGQGQTEDATAYSDDTPCS